MVTYPDEMVNDALGKMLRKNVGRLPVVSRQEPRKLVGYFGRATILRAQLQRLEEKEVRDTGWLHKQK